MSGKDKYYILHLFDKLNEGNISDEEIAHLSNFFMSHQESNKWPLDEVSKEDIKIPSFKNIKSKIQHKEPKVIPRYIQPIFKYVVAAMVAILILLPSFFKNKKELEPIIVNSKIEPGTDKATLTLEDGTNIVLENHEEYIANNIKSNGKELIYAETNQKNRTVAYNYLTVPRGGQYFVKLSDGTKVWLNSESQLKYPKSFIEGKPRVVELIYGEAYFDVSSSTKHKGSKFKVHHNVQEIEVLGTEFNIKAYKNETNVYTTLIEGKVTINATGDNKELSPNEQASLNSLTKELSITPIEAYNEVSWKEGIFIFKRRSLKEIMQVLSRWYDIDVVFANKNLEHLRFTGALGRSQNISDILNSIKSYGVLKNYEIKNKTIVLK